jgi:uncharacterized membrane protein HdeD (DUF308 family)
VNIPIFAIFLFMAGVGLLFLGIRYKPSIASGRPKALIAGLIFIVAAIIMLIKYFRGDYA